MLERNLEIEVTNQGDSYMFSMLFTLLDIIFPLIIINNSKNLAKMSHLIYIKSIGPNDGMRSCVAKGWGSPVTDITS